jgi:hypothetical protein
MAPLGESAVIASGGGGATAGGAGGGTTVVWLSVSVVAEVRHALFKIGALFGKHRLQVLKYRQMLTADELELVIKHTK